jgi:hypothetical protein
MPTPPPRPFAIDCERARRRRRLAEADRIEASWPSKPLSEEELREMERGLQRMPEEELRRLLRVWKRSEERRMRRRLLGWSWARRQTPALCIRARLPWQAGQRRRRREVRGCSRRSSAHSGDGPGDDPDLAEPRLWRITGRVARRPVGARGDLPSIRRRCPVRRHIRPYTFEQHQVKHRHLAPHERLRLFGRLPAWRQRQAWRQLARSIELARRAS